MKGVIAGAAALLVSACAVGAVEPAGLHSELDAARQAGKAPQAGGNEEGAAMADDKGGVTGLPHARGKSFATLEDYLGHLEKLSHEDTPYYRQVEPGVYRLDAGRQPPWLKGESARLYTREELAAKFGFAPGGDGPAEAGDDETR